MIDFGLARPWKEGQSQDTCNVVTLHYRAPELLLGDRKYRLAVDAWSCGCIFAELLFTKSEALFPGGFGGPAADGAERDRGERCDMLQRIFMLRGPPTEQAWPGVGRLPFYRRFCEATHYDPARAAQQAAQASGGAAPDYARALAATCERTSAGTRAKHAQTAAKRARAAAANAGRSVTGLGAGVNPNPGAHRAARNPRAVALLGGLLALDPRRRLGARAALEHDYFWSDPMPCPPAELAKLEPAKLVVGSSRLNEDQAQKEKAESWAGPAPARFVPAFMRQQMAGLAVGAGGAGGGGCAGGGAAAPPMRMPPRQQSFQNPLRPPLPHFTPGVTPAGAPPLPPGGPPPPSKQ